MHQTKMKYLTLALMLFIVPLAMAEGETALGRIFSMVHSFFKSKFSRKSMCKDLECPSFKVEMKRDKYELRCYDPTKWVMTEAPGSMAQRKLFWKLFEYINGTNVEKTKIKMTAPVRIKKPLDGTKIARGNMEMSFWIPKKFQASPPAPTDKSVKIVSEKMRCFYVHSFGGYVMFDFQKIRHLKMLMKALEKDKLGDTYDAKSFVFAGYDDPRTLFGRYNEVWLEKV